MAQGAANARLGLRCVRPSDRTGLQTPSLSAAVIIYLRRRARTLPAVGCIKWSQNQVISTHYCPPFEYSNTQAPRPLLTRDASGGREEHRRTRENIPVVSQNSSCPRDVTCIVCSTLQIQYRYDIVVSRDKNRRRERWQFQKYCPGCSRDGPNKDFRDQRCYSY